MAWVSAIKRRIGENKKAADDIFVRRFAYGVYG